MIRPPFICIGAAHWDFVATAERPPAPGDDLPGRVTRRPGGVALNLALALAAGGVEVRLVSVLGADAEGAELLALATAAGVETAGCLRVAEATGRYVAVEGPDGELAAAVADCRGLEDAAMLLAAAAAAAPPGCIVPDGNLPAPAVAALIAAARDGRNVAFVPASPAKARRLAAAAAAGALLLVNRAEAEALTGRAFADAPAAAAALVAAGARLALVTDGSRAAALAGRDGACTADPPPSPVAGATGAGDALAAAVLLTLSRGTAREAALLEGLAAARRHRAGDAR